MRWKNKPNMTDTTVAGDDVLPITDVSTDQDRKITVSIIATWVVTKFTTSVAGASQTIVAAINGIRTLAQNASAAAATAQSGVNTNAAAIQQANANIATNATNIATNASNIATLNQDMETTNDNVDALSEQVSTMDVRVETAVGQAEEASAEATAAATTANEAAELVQEIIEGGGTVLSVFGRSGVVEAEAGDYSSDEISHGEGTVADALTFDNVPLSGSQKAVKSGGVYSAINGVTTYNHTNFSYEANSTYYATSGANQPKAYKCGRIVTLVGCFKNTSEIALSSDSVKIGSVPSACKPISTYRAVVQGSGKNSFLLTVESDGSIGVARYGTSSSVAFPSGSWLNIGCTYIAAS